MQRNRFGPKRRTNRNAKLAGPANGSRLFQKKTLGPYVGPFAGKMIAVVNLYQKRHNEMTVADDTEPIEPKPLIWVASSKKAIRGFPKEVRRTFGQALYDAQTGEKHPDAKPLRGFGGAGVLEVVEDSRGSTFRAVYTVKFAATSCTRFRKRARQE
jgi:phage-related protein